MRSAASIKPEHKQSKISSQVARASVVDARPESGGAVLMPNCVHMHFVPAARRRMCNPLWSRGSTNLTGQPCTMQRHNLVQDTVSMRVLSGPARAVMLVLPEEGTLDEQHPEVV